jgi:hypothetical protein
MDGPWSCARVEEDHFWDLLEKLKEFERLTWYEIDTRYDLRSKHHHIPLSSPKLNPQVAERLAALQIDADRIFSFRLGATRRLWGVRDGPCFRILWWDPNHSVYELDA